ncbi:restriction endonuclease subunit S [Aliarcobacter skirrowii]|uniref:restriction endonuclease subunit S n=1 Tax=Aliarcobacter skirrowii TaxID=28200 RepID=UPI0029A51407|nr:restriction endonuclease subunit S [Aliarcobacter skirrowii]MDX3959989.1 restriction endonuclease subunit S [Aliarcobacter skirrowii]
MSELYKLPDGWEWKKLENISKKIFAGGDKPDKVSECKTDELNIPIYANAVKNNGLYGYSNIYKVDEECITISARGTIGFTVVRNEKFFPIVRLIVLIPNEQVLSKILKYYLDYELVENTGSSIPQLTVPTVKELFFPLPPLEEQKRIVAKLDILFAKIDKAIDLHQKNIDEADIFMASVLNDVFGELEEKYNKEKFDGIKTSNVIGLVRSVKEQSPSLQYQYVKMNNITNNNRFTFDNIINVDATDEEVRKFNLEKGDFLFNTRNSAELVGKSCIFDYDMKNILYNNNIMRVRFRDDISSYFVSYQFGCNYLKEQLENIKSATTNVAAIYYKTLKEIDVVIPPLQIQQKVVSYLDEISNKIEKIKQIQKEKMQSLKELKASILDKAFKGEL